MSVSKRDLIQIDSLLHLFCLKYTGKTLTNGDWYSDSNKFPETLDCLKNLKREKKELEMELFLMGWQMATIC